MSVPCWRCREACQRCGPCGVDMKFVCNCRPSFKCLLFPGLHTYRFWLNSGRPNLCGRSSEESHDIDLRAKNAQLHPALVVTCSPPDMFVRALAAGDLAGCVAVRRRRRCSGDAAMDETGWDMHGDAAIRSVWPRTARRGKLCGWDGRLFKMNSKPTFHTVRTHSFSYSCHSSVRLSIYRSLAPVTSAESSAAGSSAVNQQLRFSRWRNTALIQKTDVSIPATSDLSAAITDVQPGKRWP
jgi:hypothetical protein